MVRGPYPEIPQWGLRGRRLGGAKRVIRNEEIGCIPVDDYRIPINQDTVWSAYYYNIEREKTILEYTIFYNFFMLSN